MTDRDGKPGRGLAHGSPTRSRQHERSTVYAAAGVQLGGRGGWSHLAAAARSTPVRLWGAEAALWALLVRGHDRGAIVTTDGGGNRRATTRQPPVTSDGLLALWEDKGYLTREAADG